MAEVTTEEFALTENARALSGNPVVLVWPLLNFEVHVELDTLTFLISQIPDMKLPHHPLLLQQFGRSIAVELFATLVGSPYSEHSAQQEVILPSHMPDCLAL
jgi:hypothetical protein